MCKSVQEVCRSFVNLFGLPQSVTLPHSFKESSQSLHLRGFGESLFINEKHQRSLMFRESVLTTEKRVGGLKNFGEWILTIANV